MILPSPTGSSKRSLVQKKTPSSTVVAELPIQSVFSFRLRPGSSIAETEIYPETVDLDNFDGLFQLSEYLEARVRRGDPARDLVVEPCSEPTEPGDDAVSADKDMWLYVHILRLPKDLTTLVTSLLETCRSDSCPQMKAGEWQYMCAAHSSAKSCAATSYMTHTLDQACQLLTSPKLFPSRLSIPQTSLNPLRQTARRLSRIFSHAYHHHREVFEYAEAETSLYERFILLSERYNLVPRTDLAIPSDRFLSSRNLPSTSSSLSSPSNSLGESSYKTSQSAHSSKTRGVSGQISTDRMGQFNQDSRGSDNDDDDENVFSRGPRSLERDRSTTGGRGRAPRGKIIDFEIGRGTGSESESESDEDDTEEDRREEDVLDGEKLRASIGLENQLSIPSKLSVPASSPMPSSSPSKPISTHKPRRIKPKSTKLPTARSTI
ncbi:Cell cycle-associated protein [Phaffia rhodozyma]|uniref:Cell cycle-associated protein n=1 Tax=Phaffia rhodozyma TaxID=264483 RepID=A0A0F7SS74_PHARH|nr:Cell cycle-associated protein [Phaffia rhodozyma]